MVGQKSLQRGLVFALNSRWWETPPSGEQYLTCLQADRCIRSSSGWASPWVALVDSDSEVFRDHSQMTTTVETMKTKWILLVSLKRTSLLHSAMRLHPRKKLGKDPRCRAGQGADFRYSNKNEVGWICASAPGNFTQLVLHLDFDFFSMRVGFYFIYLQNNHWRRIKRPAVNLRISTQLVSLNLWYWNPHSNSLSA